MRQGKQKSSVIAGLLLGVVLAMTACGRDIYFDFVPVSPEGWGKDTLCTFTVEVEDTLSLYDMYIHVRSTPAYPYQNLWLFLSETTPEGTVTADTVEFYLTDRHGRPLGSGMGERKEMPVLYRQGIRFDRRGTYQYTIGHGMRTDLLRGLSDVGIKIEKEVYGKE